VYSSILYLIYSKLEGKAKLTAALVSIDEKWHYVFALIGSKTDMFKTLSAAAVVL